MPLSRPSLSPGLGERLPVLVGGADDVRVQRRSGGEAVGADARAQAHVQVGGRMFTISALTRSRLVAVIVGTATSVAV